MLTQQSVASQPRHERLAPGTRHHYYLSSASGSVPVRIKEYDGLALMIVDLPRVTHRGVRDRCKSALRHLRGAPVGEILVQRGRRLRPLELSFHRYVDGHLSTKGSSIKTDDLGKVINVVG